MLAVGLLVIADRPMRCYQCNSAKDAKCDSSNASDLRQYIKLCPLLTEGTYAGNQPIACRKIVQNVEELPVQIIRECAYTGNKHLDGMRKQGNKAIKLFYYQCENVDGDTPCNGTKQITTQYFILILLLATIIAAALTKYQ
ncbi:RNA-directed RNA polymerase [Dirofilaria immitis]